MCIDVELFSVNVPLHGWAIIYLIIFNIMDIQVIISNFFLSANNMQQIFLWVNIFIPV
jgi:hypothetical protein